MRVLLKIIICTIALTGCSDKADPEKPVALAKVRLENIELRQGVVCLKSSGEPLTGVVEEFWPNGKRKKSTGYKSGKLHGEVLEWYLSGQKKSKGQWVNGVREGARFVYSEDGLEQYEETYREGVLVSQKGSASEKLKAQIREAAFSREKMDQEVWKDEITAQEYEATIVRLWDDLRAAKHDWQPLHRGEERVIFRIGLHKVLVAQHRIIQLHNIYVMMFIGHFSVNPHKPFYKVKKDQPLLNLVNSIQPTVTDTSC
jgi:hypothetical protein